MSMHREPKSVETRLLDMLGRAAGYTSKMGHSRDPTAKAQFCMHMGKALNGAAALLGMDNGTKKEVLRMLLRVGAAEGMEFGPFEAQHIEYAERIAGHVQALVAETRGRRIEADDKLIFAYAGAREAYENLVSSIRS